MSPSSQQSSSRDNPDSGLTFWGHLDVLRSVIIRVVIVLVALTVAFFALMPYIFDNIILAPTRPDFFLYHLFAQGLTGAAFLPDFTSEGFHVDLININLSSQFFIHMSTSFWLALVFAFPIVIYLLWGFISPGLYEREKRGARTAFLMGNVMFFLGITVGYCLVFPLTLRFLADYHVSPSVPNIISLDSYMDTFLMLIFVMGVVFELPLLAWLLGKTGILRRGFFNRYRRHAVVALLILAAFITPTADPFTLLVVFLQIYLLWEFSALLVPAQGKADTALDDA